MKILLVLTLLFASLLANERPKIALVLSGGGARGGAHVGVLKVLEKNRVPIDMIVGTSMGSFVGGLYVSGKSPQEIEKMLVSTDWKKYITADFERSDIPMRRKEVDYIYQGRLGLGINADNNLVLPTGVLMRQPMLLKFMQLTQTSDSIKDFDKLSIPFRAVATNIKNGQQVVLSHGSLAKSIYASSSIPGGFQPIRINGIDLVDGGVSDNIPIQVARDMGADIIIAVDVSENFDEDLDVNSYFVVMGQLVNILMRKNANESLQTLSEKDILLTPDLVGFGGLDADKYAQIIQKGVDIATASQDKLQKLSISPEAYALYRQKHRSVHKQSEVIIDAIEIQNPTYLSDTSIRNRIHQKVGQALDKDILRADLLHMYNMMIFDSVNYEVREVNNLNTLVIKTTPSWDNHGEIRFALGLEDDFSGHSAYSLKVGYTLFGLSEYGAEWRSDFEIGRYEKAYTELFIPLDSMQRYYLKPSIVYGFAKDIFEAGPLGSQEISSSRYGGTLAFGAHVTTDYEFEIGVSQFKDYVYLPLNTLLSQPTSYNYDAYPIYASINIDSLDNVNFPKKGIKAELKWTKEMSSWGSDYDYDQIYFDIEKPFTFYSNNITLFMKYGKSYRKDSVNRLSGTFILGGLFNLSGYTPYSFVGDNVALGVLKYTYEIKDGGFFGTLNAPLYAGFSLETGQTWDEGMSFTHKNQKYAGSVYVAADTFLGPLYLAYGHSIDNDSRFYLYLGEKF